ARDARTTGLLRRRARGDRPLRDRLRRQPLGTLQLELTQVEASAERRERRRRDVALGHVHVAQLLPAREQRRSGGLVTSLELQDARAAQEHRAAVDLPSLVVGRQRLVRTLPRQVVLPKRRRLD